MIIGILGLLGSGKTLTLTYYGYQHYKKGRKIASNYSVKFPHEKITNPFDLDKFKNTTILLDEAWIWLDSYAVKDAVQQALIQIILNSRRRRNHLFYTAQNKFMIHARLRRVTDYYIVPELVGDPEKTNCMVKLHKVNPVVTEDMGVIQKFRLKDYAKYYDHEEELDYLYDAMGAAHALLEGVKDVKKKSKRQNA